VGMVFAAALIKSDGFLGNLGIGIQSRSKWGDGSRSERPCPT